MTGVMGLLAAAYIEAATRGACTTVIHADAVDAARGAATVATKAADDVAGVTTADTAAVKAADSVTLGVTSAEQAAALSTAADITTPDDWGDGFAADPAARGAATTAVWHTTADTDLHTVEVEKGTGAQAASSARVNDAVLDPGEQNEVSAPNGSRHEGTTVWGTGEANISTRTGGQTFFAAVSAEDMLLDPGGQNEVSVKRSDECPLASMSHTHQLPCSTWVGGALPPPDLTYAAPKCCLLTLTGTQHPLDCASHESEGHYRLSVIKNSGEVKWATSGYDGLHDVISIHAAQCAAAGLGTMRAHDADVTGTVARVATAVVDSEGGADADGDAARRVADAETGGQAGAAGVLTQDVADCGEAVGTGGHAIGHASDATATRAATEGDVEAAWVSPAYDGTGGQAGAADGSSVTCTAARAAAAAAAVDSEGGADADGDEARRVASTGTGGQAGAADVPTRDAAAFGEAIWASPDYYEMGGQATAIDVCAQNNAAHEHSAGSAITVDAAVVHDASSITYIMIMIGHLLHSKEGQHHTEVLRGWLADECRPTMAWLMGGDLAVG